MWRATTGCICLRKALGELCLTNHRPFSAPAASAIRLWPLHKGQTNCSTVVHKDARFNVFRASVSTALEPVVSSEDEVKDFFTHKSATVTESLRLEEQIKQCPIPRPDNDVRRREGRLRRRQVETETEAWRKATKEYKELTEEMCASNMAPNLPYVKSLFLGWFDPLRNAIDALQKNHHAKEGRRKIGHEEYMCMLPPDMLAVITMHKITTLLMSGQAENCSVRVVLAAMKVGEAVEHEVKVQKFLANSKKPKKTKNSEIQVVTKPQQDALSVKEKLLRQKITQLLKKNKGKLVRQMLNKNDPTKPWDDATQAKVGSALLDLLIQTAFIQPPADQCMEGPPEIRPAFKHVFKTSVDERSKKTRKYGVIECDVLVRQGLERTARHVVIPYMPMLVRPNPWKGFDKGPYLFLPSYVMRIHGAKKQREALKRVSRNQMQKVYKVLDVLGSTKWKINKKVLSVIDTLWGEGGGLADMVSREDVPLPNKPETEDAQDLKKWKWQARKAEKENSELYSQRCDLELKLSVARKMKDEAYFYYPHNLDFRGRAYPMHPYLNHLGSDLCRGILEFAEGRPLGKRGLSWLKIHLANLYGSGVDKLSFDGRLAFVEDNVSNIIDSAERPLDGKKWWLKAEDPFQFLAACISLSDALHSSSPENFICHIPVHQDGSCNGLQHYAALGRDKGISEILSAYASKGYQLVTDNMECTSIRGQKLGAEAVNLTYGERPADVYSGVAARVEEIMRRDATKDEATFKYAPLARKLCGQVSRKLVKQTVMTSVYGVTFIGAREQIKRRMKEMATFSDDEELFRASSYCAQVTLTALGEMFEAARGIMSWLNQCAKIIASENATVRWTSPLGLPIVQPYQKQKSRMVMTSLQVLALREESNKVSPRQQRTAFPPNFVHSLDSSHMMMTALSCNEAGLTFAGVHDSYWTHAANVDQMNNILREKFVELYDQPILEDLLESFQNSFPELGFPPLPERGDFDLKEVLNSPYFFN